MMRELKKYEELTIVDNFMFGKDMRDPGRCKKLLEMILKVKIRKVVLLEEEYTMNALWEMLNNMSFLMV